MTDDLCLYSHDQIERATDALDGRVPLVASEMAHILSALYNAGITVTFPEPPPPEFIVRVGPGTWFSVAERRTTLNVACFQDQSAAYEYAERLNREAAA